MTTPSPRRSGRYASVSYSSNGRDFLADQRGLSRDAFEAWIKSPTVLPHLQFWRNLCVRRGFRFNESLEWIQCKRLDYFENKSKRQKDFLEEDLLLECLGQGDLRQKLLQCFEQGDQRQESYQYADYADETARTNDWPTQDLWARAAWRIVQDNCGEGQIFTDVMKTHPARAYGFAIDLICIAFHSMAYRGVNSIWTELITSCPASEKPSNSLFHTWPMNAERQMAMDADPNDEDDYPGEDEEEECLLGDDIDSDVAESEASTLSDGESDFVEFTTPKNKKGSRRTSPVTPTKLSKRARESEDDKKSPSKKSKGPVKFTLIQKTLKADGDNMLRIFDSNGSPITGYRSAAIVQTSMSEDAEEEPRVLDENTIVLRRDSAVWSPGAKVNGSGKAAENMAKNKKKKKDGKSAAKDTNAKNCATL